MVEIGRVASSPAIDRATSWSTRSYATGFANQPTSTRPGDGLVLTDLYVAAAVRCAPPMNRPTNTERDNCAPYLVRELAALRRVRVIVALGAFAWDAALRTIAMDASIPIASTATAVRARRGGRHRLIPADRVVPSEPEEHIHGPPQPIDARGRPSARRGTHACANDCDVEPIRETQGRFEVIADDNKSYEAGKRMDAHEPRARRDASALVHDTFT